MSGLRGNFHSNGPQRRGGAEINKLHKLRVSASLRLVGVLIAMTGVAVAQDDAPKGNAESGRRVYIKTGCYQCHGREGQGSPSTGPRLGPGPSPWRAFEQYVRQPRGEMPPYTAKVLTAAELADIYAFLQSRPRPPAVSSLPF